MARANRTRDSVFMTAIDQARAVSAQRASTLMFFLFFFLLLTANDLTPAKTRRNAGSTDLGSRRGGISKGAGADQPRHRDEVRDKVIIDLSESNSRLEVENRRLRSSVIGLSEELTKLGGEKEVTAIAEAYNLTTLVSTNDGKGVPQLQGRDSNGKAALDEDEIPTASRRLLRERNAKHK